MNLLFVGGETTENISAIEPAGDYVFAAAGNKVLGFLRGKVVFQGLFAVINVGAAYARARRTDCKVTAFVDDDARHY